MEKTWHIEDMDCIIKYDDMYEVTLYLKDGREVKISGYDFVGVYRTIKDWEKWGGEV